MENSGTPHIFAIFKSRLLIQRKSVMSLQIGIYEFFAYTIPGIIYLFLTGYFLIVGYRIQTVSYTIENIPLPLFLLGLVFAYVVGLLVDPIAKKVWYNKFFRPKSGLPKLTESVDVIYGEFVAEYGIRTMIHPKYWYPVLIWLHKENPETAASFERFNASRILLRNVSFALVILAISQIIFVFQYKNYLIAIGIGVVSIVFSLVAGKESAKYHRWFYQGLFLAELVSDVKIANFVNAAMESMPEIQDENA